MTGGGSERDFTFRDGERLIRFAEGALAEAEGLLAGAGFEDYALLTTPRAEASAPPALTAGAATVLHVPAGPVPEAAAAVREGAAGRPVVALGGGRVIDSAKAVGGAGGVRVAAIPTTLSGAPFTPFHRMPAGFDGFRLVRPALALCEPSLMASAPMPGLAATAMNALAHAAEALYAPGANPVARGAGLRGAELLASGLEGSAGSEAARNDLALGSLLGGYAIGTTGFWIHHATCQTIVRTAGTPHAETNAVMLGHSLRYMATRAPERLAELAIALGAAGADPELAGDRAAALGARSGVTTLGELGIDAGAVPAIAQAVARHPMLAAAPEPPSERELRALLEAAL